MEQEPGNIEQGPPHELDHRISIGADFMGAEQLRELITTLEEELTGLSRERSARLAQIDESQKARDEGYIPDEPVAKVAMLAANRQLADTARRSADSFYEEKKSELLQKLSIAQADLKKLAN